MAINSLNAASRGLSGLVSGMDTQQMVDAMLAGTQNKIDVAKQKKTQLGYKQELYRSITSKLTAFSTKFFSYTSSNTNLLSPSFFNSMKATSASKAFNVTAGSGATVGKTKVDYITQLAQKARAKSTVDATGALSGEFDAEKLKKLTELYDKEITFKAGDQSVSVSLKDIIGTKEAGNGAFDVEKLLNDRLSSIGASVSFDGSNIKLTDASGREVSVSGDKNALAVFGLNADVKGDKGSLQMGFNLSNVMTGFNATVNGVKKTINVNILKDDGNGNAVPVDVDTLAQRLNDTMQKAFGTKVKVEKTSKGIEFKMVNSNNSVDKSSQISLTTLGSDRNLLGTLGIASGKSNKINGSMTLREANFATPISGDIQRFTINGVDFQVSANESINNVIDKINRSEAGVNVSYSTTEDRFIIESKISGALQGDAFTMSQSEGNVLTAMFGVRGSGNTTGGTLSGLDTVSGEKVKLAEDAFAADSYTVRVNVNGTAHDLEVKFEEKDERNATTFLRRLSEAVEKNEDTKGKVSFSLSTAGDETTFSMKAVGEGTTVKIESGLDFAKLDGLGAYSGTPKSDTKLSLLGLEKTEVTFTANGNNFSVKADANDTVETFRAKLDQALQTATGSTTAKADFDEQTGRYRIFGVDIPMTMHVSGDEGKLFGGDQVMEIGQQADVAMDVKAGQNAILSVNGVEIERSTNEFTVDGLTFELKETIAAAETIDVTRNTDQIYDGITKFVEEYNKLVDSINEQLDAKANYKDYPPLSEDQKAAMSDREVELWEEKAKEGLLRSDSTLQTVLSSLRSTLYTKPEGGLALYDLGITTSYFGGKDKLQIEDPDKLRQRISENIEGVQRLFTDQEKGLSHLLKDSIENATRTDPTKPGTLVRQAGATGRTDTFSSIYKEMEDLDDRISSLNRTYTSQYNRYWKQFNTMEQLIQQMNSQSSWLSQQFA